MTSRSPSDDLYHMNDLVHMILRDSQKLLRNTTSDKNTEVRQRKSQIFDYYSSIKNVLEDLEKTLIFLELKYERILEIFPDLESHQSYYTYFLENYIIRINTISDLCGKIGNLVCNSKIDDEKCNGYNFKDIIRVSNPAIGKTIGDILIYTKELKDQRHKKIHRGTTEINIMKSIVHWSDFTRFTNIKFDEILYDKTKEEINEEILKLQAELEELIELVAKYFNELAIVYTEEI